MQFFPTAVCNVTPWRLSRLRTHWLIAQAGGGVGGGGAEREVCILRSSGNCSVSNLSFVCGRSLWAELNGWEDFLHWKANMLPLFSIMSLWLCYGNYNNQEAFQTARVMPASAHKRGPA